MNDEPESRWRSLVSISGYRSAQTKNRAREPVSGGFDVVGVAEISGTSVDMIQKHYAHLQADRARQALSALSL